LFWLSRKTQDFTALTKELKADLAKATEQRNTAIGSPLCDEISLLLIILFSAPPPTGEKYMLEMQMGKLSEC
jgi:hypothetical protein